MGQPSWRNAPSAGVGQGHRGSIFRALMCGSRSTSGRVATGSTQASRASEYLYPLGAGLVLNLSRRRSLASPGSVLSILPSAHSGNRRQRTARQKEFGLQRTTLSTARPQSREIIDTAAVEQLGFPLLQACDRPKAGSVHGVKGNHAVQHGDVTLWPSPV